MAMNNFLFTFNPKKKGLRKILGDLEADIMAVVWDQRSATVRDVYEVMLGQRKIAYTTVMTVMSRLAEKGILEKTKQGQTYRYRAVFSKDELTAAASNRIFKELLGDFGKSAMAQFLDVLDSADPQKMEELARLVEQKRKGTKDS